MPSSKNPSNKSEKDETSSVPANSDLTEQKEETPSVPTQQTPDNHDETDVAAARQRTTQDGKGPDPVPETDFDSFATAGVEKSNDRLSVQDVASEVLGGRWGANFAVAQQNLANAGYDVDDVWEEVQRRKAGGAPSAF